MSRAKVTELDKQRAFTYGAVVEMNKTLGISRGGVGDDEMHDLLGDSRNREMEGVADKPAVEAEEIITEWAEKEPEKLRDFLVFLANSIEEGEEKDRQLSRTPFPNVLQAFYNYRQALVANAARRVDFGFIDAAANAIPVTQMFPLGAVSPYLQIAENALTAYQYVPSLLPLIRDGSRWLINGVRRIWNNRKLKKLRHLQDMVAKKHQEKTPKQIAMLKRSSAKRESDRPPLAIADVVSSGRRDLSNEFNAVAQSAQSRRSAQSQQRAPPMRPPPKMSIARASQSYEELRPAGVGRFDQRFGYVGNRFQADDDADDEDEEMATPSGRRTRGSTASKPSGVRDDDTEIEQPPPDQEGAGVKKPQITDIKGVAFHGALWSKPKAKKFVKQLELTQYGNIKEINNTLIVRVVDKKINFNKLKAFPISKSVVYLY